MSVEGLPTGRSYRYSWRYCFIFCAQGDKAHATQTLVSTPTQAFFVYRIYICAYGVSDSSPCFTYRCSVSGKNIVAPLLWVRSLYFSWIPMRLKPCSMRRLSKRFTKLVRLYRLSGDWNLIEATLNISGRYPWVDIDQIHIIQGWHHYILSLPGEIVLYCGWVR